MQDWGGILLLPDAMAAHPGAATVFSPRSSRTPTYFEPSTRDFMINLAVDDLDGVLAQLCEARRDARENLPRGSPTASFAHIMDPEGNKIELWQPKPMG